MSRPIQDLIRPTLTPVDNRNQELKNLGSAVQALSPGHAIALLAAPGVDLRRLADDILRGIGDPILVIWINLVELSRHIHSQPGADPSAEWEEALNLMLQDAFERGLSAERIAADSLQQLDEAEDPAAARLNRFVLLCRRARRAPVLVVESMHRLPWAVSARFQQTLRKVLDHGDRTLQLRLVLTSSSDFLSGDVIGEGDDGSGASPLFFRTTRLTVQPYREDQLYELTPLPGGLPDEFITHLLALTGGSVGLLELFLSAIGRDPALGMALHEALAQAPGRTPPSWFWQIVSRLEPLALPARQLLREGLGALISNRSGRSLQVIRALTDLVEGRGRDETSAEPLLPLELAGLVQVQRQQTVYQYRFTSPMVPELLRAILPVGRSLRDQLDQFAREFRWEEIAPKLPEVLPTALEPAARRSGQFPNTMLAEALKELQGHEGEFSPRKSGQFSRLHIMPQVPESEPSADKSPDKAQAERAGTDKTAEKSTESPERPRSPFDVPPVVEMLQKDTGPESARLLIRLLLATVESTIEARQSGNQTLLSPAHFELSWFTRTGTGPADLKPGDPITTEPKLEDVLQKVDRWDLQLRDLSSANPELLEGAALFLPPESLSRLLQHRYSNGAQRFRPSASDDAYAIGQMIGLLLGTEPNPTRSIERVENRLRTARDLAVGPLVRLLKRCQAPDARRRPSLEEIRKVLQQVLDDPHRLLRTSLRYVTFAAMVIVVVLGIVDFVLDAQVLNSNWVYTAAKLGGAGMWAAFYGAGWLVLGRTDKSDIQKHFLDFIYQRMNRVRWLLVPLVMSLGFSALFANRLYNHWGVQLSLPLEHKLEEIKAVGPGTNECSSVIRFPSPVTYAKVRLNMTQQEYIFILDHEPKNGPVTRTEHYLDQAMIQKLRTRKWGESLHLEPLVKPPPEKSCLPGEPPPRGY
ncbi:MAG: hypothetical protein ACKO6N_02705 [Myxococcota bacterium]